MLSEFFGNNQSCCGKTIVFEETLGYKAGIGPYRRLLNAAFSRPTM